MNVFILLKSDENGTTNAVIGVYSSYTSAKVARDWWLEDGVSCWIEEAPHYD